MQLGGRQLSLVCHAITVQNSRTFCQMEAKRVRKQRCTRFDMGNIMPGWRYEQTPNLSQIVSLNIDMVCFILPSFGRWVEFAIQGFLAESQSSFLTFENSSSQHNLTKSSICYRLRIAQSKLLVLLVCACFLIIRLCNCDGDYDH